MPKVTDFDPSNPDKRFVAMVLYQAYCGASKVVDVYAEAWCLSDFGLDAWQRLLNHLLEHKLIQESGEPDYYRCTQKGEEVAAGMDY